MAADPENDPVRSLLRRLLAERGVALVPLSKAIGKNRAYFQQYFNRGRPRFLPPAVRNALGDYFSVDAEEFRHPEDPGDPREGVNRALVIRAFDYARLVIGEAPADEWLRVEVAATALVLLEHQEAGLPIVIDAEETVRTLRLLVQRIRDHYQKANE